MLKTEFSILFKAIWQKFQSKNGIPDEKLFVAKNSPRTSYYPIKADEASAPNLAQDMMEELRDLPHLNGKKLYEYFTESKREGSENISISAFYLATYCQYLGCNNLDDFRARFVQKRTEFMGWHYSVRRREVLPFEFSVDLNEAPYKATMRGYWLRYPKRECSGEGQLKKDGLFFALDYEEGSFYMVLHIKDLSDLENQFVLGRVLTISSWEFPISSEIFLIKKGEQWDVPKKLRMEQYFHLKRPTQRTIDREYRGELGNLKIRGSKPNEFKIQVGCYRTWVYNTKGLLLQQKFIVRPDYTAYLERKTKAHVNTNGLNKLFCFLSFNQNPIKRILLSLHPQNSYSYIGYTILQELRPSSEYILGAYINTGDDTRPPAHHAVILRYEPDETSFEAEVFNTAEDGFRELIKNDTGLEKMKRCLDLHEANNYSELAKLLAS